jgi:hypothetical protein
MRVGAPLAGRRARMHPESAVASATQARQRMPLGRKTSSVTGKHPLGRHWLACGMAVHRLLGHTLWLAGGKDVSAEVLARSPCNTPRWRGPPKAPN